MFQPFLRAVLQTLSVHRGPAERHYSRLQASWFRNGRSVYGLLSTPVWSANRNDPTPSCFPSRHVATRALVLLVRSCSISATGSQVPSTKPPRGGSYSWCQGWLLIESDPLSLCQTEKVLTELDRRSPTCYFSVHL